jgi:hypothetical protein
MPAKEHTDSKVKPDNEPGAAPGQPTVTVTVSPSVPQNDGDPQEPSTLTVIVTATVQFPTHPITAKVQYPTHPLTAKVQFPTHPN